MTCLGGSDIHGEEDRQHMVPGEASLVHSLGSDKSKYENID